MGPSTVYVVDDDPAVLRGLERLMRSAGLPCVGHASSEEFLASLPDDAGGCAILDLSLPGLNGLELQRAIAVRGVLLETVFITGHGEVPAVVQAIKEGAIDFLVKPFNPERLLAIVRAAIEVNLRRWSERLDVDALRARLQRLTPRETEILRFVIGGHLNKQIGAELDMSEKTVKFHRGHIVSKLEANSVTDLVRMAQRVGIEPILRMR